MERRSSRLRTCAPLGRSSSGSCAARNVRPRSRPASPARSVSRAAGTRRRSACWSAGNRRCWRSTRRGGTADAGFAVKAPDGYVVAWRPVRTRARDGPRAAGRRRDRVALDRPGATIAALAARPAEPRTARSGARAGRTRGRRASSSSIRRSIAAGRSPARPRTCRPRSGRTCSCCRTRRTPPRGLHSRRRTTSRSLSERSRSCLRWLPGSRFSSTAAGGGALVWRKVTSLVNRQSSERGTGLQRLHPVVQRGVDRRRDHRQHPRPNRAGTSKSSSSTIAAPTTARRRSCASATIASLPSQRQKPRLRGQRRALLRTGARQIRLPDGKRRHPRADRARADAAGVRAGSGDRARDAAVLLVRVGPARAARALHSAARPERDDGRRASTADDAVVRRRAQLDQSAFGARVSARRARARLSSRVLHRARLSVLGDVEAPSGRVFERIRPRRANRLEPDAYAREHLRAVADAVVDLDVRARLRGAALGASTACRLRTPRRARRGARADPLFGRFRAVRARGRDARAAAAAQPREPEVPRLRAVPRGAAAPRRRGGWSTATSRS